jgi:hypothetical protein
VVAVASSEIITAHTMLSLDVLDYSLDTAYRSVSLGIGVVT